jgi:hypothetical protein
VSAETPCGPGPDARYCEKFWKLDAEVTRLHRLIRELLDNTGLDDDEQAAWLERAGIHDDDKDNDSA